MPGPVSDSYDPEFGTAANAAEVAEAIGKVRDEITRAIGEERLSPILDVVRGHPAGHGPLKPLALTERELRIIRFAMNCALESF